MSQYAIGADVPAVRTSRLKASVSRFAISFVLYTGLCWVTDHWLLSPESLPKLLGRGAFFALMMSFIGNSSKERDSLLIITEDYVEKKYLSPVGTTIDSQKIYRRRIGKVSEVNLRVKPFRSLRRKGLMIIEAGMLRHSIFVPETTHDYADIKTKLLDWATLVRLS